MSEMVLEVVVHTEIVLKQDKSIRELARSEQSNMKSPKRTSTKPKHHSFSLHVTVLSRYSFKNAVLSRYSQRGLGYYAIVPELCNLKSESLREWFQNERKFKLVAPCCSKARCQGLGFLKRGRISKSAPASPRAAQRPRITVLSKLGVTKINMILMK